MLISPVSGSCKIRVLFKVKCTPHLTV